MEYNRAFFALFSLSAGGFILIQNNGELIHEYHGMGYLMITLFVLGIWHLAIAIDRLILTLDND